MQERAPIGGRRLDLELISRSTPFCRTDFPAGPTVKQCHTYGISSWIPLNATGAMNPAKDTAYTARSTWSGCLGYGLFGDGEAARARANPGTYDFDKAKAELQQYRNVRKYFLGDYYPLTDYSQAEDAWMSWQFHRGDLGEGLVQVFRRPRSICESGKINLQGLDPKARYSVVNLDTREERPMTGDELANKGLVVSLPERPSSAVFTYKRKA